jgi:hypothetical protein
MDLEGSGRDLLEVLCRRLLEGTDENDGKLNSLCYCHAMLQRILSNLQPCFCLGYDTVFRIAL